MPSLRIQLGGVGVALVVSAAACSSILGIHGIVPLSDGGADTGSDADHAVLDGNGGVPSDADAFDAGQDALDTGTDALDAGMDVLDTGIDASFDAPGDSFDAQADALADAPPQPGDASEPDLPCAQQGTYLFCDDFDSVTSVTQNWSGDVEALEGGTWSLDTIDYVSSPASARATGPALANGQMDNYLDVPPLTYWIRVAFDLRVDVSSYVGIPYLGIANLYVDVGSGTSILYAIQQNGTAEIVASNPHGNETYVVAAPPLGTWVRIVLQYDGSTGMTAWQSGTQIASDGTCAGTTPSGPQLFLGASGVAGSSEAFALEIDNVVVRGQ